MSRRRKRRPPDVLAPARNGPADPARAPHRRHESSVRHVVHWRPEDWARQQVDADEAERLRRAAHRQSAALGCLIPAGLIGAAAVSGSGAPLGLLVLLMAVGAVLVVRDGLRNWFAGR